MSIRINGGSPIVNVYANGSSTPGYVYSNAGVLVHPTFSGFDGADSLVDLYGIIRGILSNVGTQLTGYHEYGYPEGNIYIGTDGNFTDGYLLTRGNNSPFNRVFEIQVNSNVFRARGFVNDAPMGWSPNLAYSPLTGFENKKILGEIVRYGMEGDGGFRFRFCHDNEVSPTWINLVRS